MQAHEINTTRPFLDVLIHDAIVDSVTSVVAKCNKIGSTPQEPDFIASLTLEFTPNLFKILKKVFPKNRFSVTGIFCHQKPLADIGLHKSPELGDILFVYIHTDSTGARRYNSLLLQAKMSTVEITRISTADQHQLTLYKDWPDFRYRRANRLNGTLRSIQPKVCNDGAQYLLIDNDPRLGLAGISGTFPMGCALPQDILTLDRNLASELVNFLKFKAGRMFEEDPNTSNDHWTKMIWEMLEITKLKASTRKNAGFNNFPRQISNQADGLCFIASETSSIFSDLESSLRDGNNKNNSEFIDDNNGGLSVIVIESTQQEG